MAEEKFDADNYFKSYGEEIETEPVKVNVEIDGRQYNGEFCFEEDTFFGRAGDGQMIELKPGHPALSRIREEAIKKGPVNVYWGGRYGDLEVSSRLILFVGFPERLREKFGLGKSIRR